MTWDYLHKRRSTNGCAGAAQVPRVPQAAFCALIGRPHDPQLRSVVKRGAWHTCDVPFRTVFGGDAPKPTGTGGRYGCNRDLGIDTTEDLVMKYSPSTQTLSIGAYVSHVDTHGDGP